MTTIGILLILYILVGAFLVGVTVVPEDNLLYMIVALVLWLPVLVFTIIITKKEIDRND